MFGKGSDFINVDNLKTCCFSGHRPEKLFEGKGVGSEEVRRLLSVLKLAIDNTISEGYDTFITGMARGIDMWAATLVAEIKVKKPEIKLICAMPYRNHGRSFKGRDKWELSTILSVADEVVYVSEEYSRFCMQKRNRFMVDNSSKLIAVVSDYRSGTGQTIRYAQQAGIQTRIIDIKSNAAMFHTYSY